MNKLSNLFNNLIELEGSMMAYTEHSAPNPYSGNKPRPVYLLKDDLTLSIVALTLPNGNEERTLTVMRELPFASIIPEYFSSLVKALSLDENDARVVGRTMKYGGDVEVDIIEKEEQCSITAAFTNPNRFDYYWISADDMGKRKIPVHSSIEKIYVKNNGGKVEASRYGFVSLTLTGTNEELLEKLQEIDKVI